VNYFTLRTSIIWMETIKDLYISARPARRRVKRTLSRHRRMSESDPNVWSGRALQEDFFELADVRSCINVSGL